MQSSSSSTRELLHPDLADAHRATGDDGQCRHRHRDGRAALRHRPCRCRHRLIHHGHHPDVADQRVACRATHHRPPVWRRAARRHRARDTPGRVDIAGAGTRGDPAAVFPRTHHRDLGPAARSGNQGARLSGRLGVGRARRLRLAFVLRPFHGDRPPASGDVLQPAVAGTQGSAERTVHVRPARLAGDGLHRLRSGNVGGCLADGGTRLGLVPAPSAIRASSNCAGASPHQTSRQYANSSSSASPSA